MRDVASVQVRETAQLVLRAAELRQRGTAGSEALGATSTWLREHHIISALLRANLHLAQYVAQVSRFWMHSPSHVHQRKCEH